MEHVKTVQVFIRVVYISDLQDSATVEAAAALRSVHPSSQHISTEQAVGRRGSC